MGISRRAFLGYSTLAAGASLFPFRAAMAQLPTVNLGNKTLMVIFLRGGADGMQLVPRTGASVYVEEPEQIVAYKALRPARVEKIDPEAATVPENNYIGYFPENERSSMPVGAPSQPLTLDGYFELHPHLESFKSLYDAGQLAVIHAVGQSGSRSHFDAQDAVEYGNPLPLSGVQSATTGWMHDAIDIQLGGAQWGDEAQKVAAGLGFSTDLPLSLAGSGQADKIASFSAMEGFGFSSGTTAAKKSVIKDLFTIKDGFSALRSSATTAMNIEQKAASVPRGGNGRILAATNAALAGVGVNIGGNSTFASRLEDVADMVKAGMAPAFVNIDLGSWDSHNNQFTHVNGVAAALDAVGHFYNDLGSEHSSNVCTLIMTEFGRTLDVNGDHGTDHGYGGVMFAIGGGVNGGQVYGEWPGLPVWNGQQWVNTQGYSQSVSEVSGKPLLTATTSFQQVYYELLGGFMQLPSQQILDVVLKGYTPGTTLGLFA